MYPVAQNLQLREQPICEETQAVLRSSVGMRTPSTICPSTVLKRLFTVPSSEYCVVLVVNAGRLKCSFNLALNSLLRFVMASKLWACFSHNHSYTCLALNFFSPRVSKYCSSSS